MITTSRYASESTRRLARMMAASRNDAYIARGKKTVDELAALARKRGDSRISVIEEEGGRPERIAKIAVDELGQWRWLEERLLNSTEKDIGAEVSDESKVRD